MGFKSKLRASFKVFASLLIAVVVGEVTVRVYYKVVGRPYHVWTTYAQAEGFVKDARAGAVVGEGEGEDGEKYVLSPISAWEPYGFGAKVEADRARFVSGKADETYDVLLLGSSIAAGFGNVGPRIVPKRLKGAATVDGRPVRFLAYGGSAFKQPQQLNRFHWLLARGFEPDLVIVIDGLNELSVSLSNEKASVSYLLPSWGTWGPQMADVPADPETRRYIAELEESIQVLEGRFEFWSRYKLYQSALFGRLGFAWIGSANRDRHMAGVHLNRHLATLSNRRFGSYPNELNNELVIQEATDMWFQCWRSMADICRARGIRLAQVLQPNPMVPGSKALTAEEEAGIVTADFWVMAAEQGIPLIRERQAELRELGVLAYDATMIFKDTPETVWRDAGHLNHDGLHALGNWICDRLLEDLDS